MDGVIVEYKGENRVRIIDQAQPTVLPIDMIGTMYELKRHQLVGELITQTTNKEVKKSQVKKMKLKGPKSWKSVTKTTKQFNRHQKTRRK